MTRPRTRRSEHGTSAVEAAWSLFVLFTFIFGMAAGARVLNVQQALTNAAREGARLGVLPLRGTSTLASAGDIENEVRRYLASAWIPADDKTTISVQRENRAGTNYTHVTVTTRYTFVTLSWYSLFTLDINLSGSSLMRDETSP